MSAPQLTKYNDVEVLAYYVKKFKEDFIQYRRDLVDHFIFVKKCYQLTDNDMEFYMHVKIHLDQTSPVGSHSFVGADGRRVSLGSLCRRVCSNMILYSKNEIYDNLEYTTKGNVVFKCSKCERDTCPSMYNKYLRFNEMIYLVHRHNLKMDLRELPEIKSWVGQVIKTEGKCLRVLDLEIPLLEFRMLEYMLMDPHLSAGQYRPEYIAGHDIPDRVIKFDLKCYGSE